jgi:Ca2+-binding RTX toxin-like protein
MVRIAFGLGLLTLMGLLLLSLVSVLTAANTVPPTKFLDSTIAITADALKPTDCAAITLNNMVTGSGAISGTGQDDLILGSPGVDTIAAHPGNDCILGGGGDDSIDGDAGTDVCIGGPGTDTFAQCETTVQ